jgi:hypothetical protein
MAKKRKISPRRLQGARDWLSTASPEQLGRYANLVPVSLQRAAEAVGLDPHNEWHCEILVRILAHLMFGEGKRGRPKHTTKWDAQRGFDLGHHFHLVQQERPKIKFSEAAKAIKLRWPEVYAGCSEMTLRQRVHDAYLWFKDMKEEMDALDKQIEEDLARRQKATP